MGIPGLDDNSPVKLDGINARIWRESPVENPND